jgi:hypothetical protein
MSEAGDLRAARESTVSRLIAMRFTRPGRPGILWEATFEAQRGWQPDPFLVSEFRGPFIVEQRVIPDGLWVKVAEATDGWRTLAWNENGIVPVTYDIEWDLGII